MTSKRLVALLPLAAALAVSLARAQDWQDPPPNDPFATPSTLRGAGDPAATWSQSLVIGIPPMSVRGTLRVRGRAPGALLQIGEGVHVVRPGDRISAMQGTLEVPLEILQIDDRSVVLRVGAADGVVITVR